MFKKITAMLLVFAMLFLLSFSNVVAVGNPTISVSSATANPGDNITLKVSIANNPGINTFSLGFNYDTTKLSITNVTASPNLGGQFTYSKKAVWLNGSDSTYNGEILTISLKVADSAAAGETSVAVTYRTGDISNYNEDDVNFNLVAGKVTIESVGGATGGMEVTTAEGTPGDTVDLRVNITQNPGINTFTLGFSYDTTKLNLLSVIPSDNLGGQFTYSRKAVWLNSSDTNYTGTIMTLRFKILEDAAAGDTQVTVTYNTGDISNYNEDDIDFTVTAGKITIAQQEANNGKFELSSGTGKGGDTVDLTVNMTKNPGINTFALGFSYDADKLTLLSVTPSDNLGGQFTYSKKAVWLNSSDTTYTGELMTLHFKIADDATGGDVAVNLTYSAGDISNYDEQDVDFESVAGKITIEKSAADIPGDANGDGEVTTKDSVAIMRWISGGWDISINEENADVNNDNSVDLKDSVLIKRYLAGGWGVELV